ncbi:MAG: divalent-cation tolerance protein CutA [Pirellulales bacterium]
MTPYVEVVTTVADAATADAIADALVRRRRAACGQTSGPITSHYWWQGKLETSSEWYCVLKTRADLFDRVEAAIRELHPYDEPEILARPIVAGSASYLGWLDGELSA